MKKTTMLKLGAAAALAAPFAAQATLYTFNATLKGENERPTPFVTTGSGIASLQYDDKGTVSLLDDTFTVALAAFNLSGPPTGFHIHAAGTTEETASIRVDFDNPSNTQFIKTVVGNNLVVGGISGVVSVAPGLTNGMIPATPASATNAGHPEMSFLDALRSGLAYTNVHTDLHPSGEIRGQLIQVAAVPEPETYALMAAGLGLIGWAASRRRKVGV